MSYRLLCHHSLLLVENTKLTGLETGAEGWLDSTSYPTLVNSFHSNQLFLPISDDEMSSDTRSVFPPMLFNLSSSSLLYMEEARTCITDL